MPRSRAPARRDPAAAHAAPQLPGAPWADVLLAFAAAAIVVVVFQRAAGYFFRADDFEGLARARGLLPPREGLARLIPWRLYFEVMGAGFGLDPRPYHAASLATLAAAAALVFAWLRAPAGRWAAFAGAAFFASHPAHYASAYWISAIGDPMVTLFTVGALLAARSARPVRWSALPLFALALVSKESALLAPLVAFADPGRSPALPRARRDLLPWSLVLMSAGMVAYYLLADPLGARHAAGQAYVPRLGGHLALNLLTYAGWTVNVPVATVRSVGDAIDPTVFVAGGAALAVGLAGLAVPRLRRAGWLAGGLMWGAMIAPVLPLAHHTYRYYLTGSLAGAALVLAAALATLARAMPSRVVAQAGPATAIGALGLATLLAWNAAVLVHRIEFTPFVTPGSRSDSVVDRALIAGRVAEGLRATPPPAGVTLRFWSPRSREVAGLADSAETLGYWERNVSAAMLEGIGVRVLCPQVKRVEFVPRFTPGGDSLWYAVYTPDGSLRVGPAAEIERGLRTVTPPVR